VTFFALLLATAVSAGAGELLVDTLDARGARAAPALEGLAGVIRARAVRIDFDALLAGAAASSGDTPVEPAPAERLTLTLWPGLAVDAVYDAHAAERASDRFAWVGRLVAPDDGQVVILASGGRLVGSVRTAAGTFRIRPAGDLHVVEEIDLAALPPELAPIAVPEPEGPAALDKAETAADDDGSTIDLLVVYTPAAREFLARFSGIENMVALSVAEGNVAFANSGVLPRLRLVQLAEVAYDEPTLVFEDLGSMLLKLADPTDGAMDEAHALRDRYGADLVQLIPRSTEGCGVAFIMGGSNNTAFAANAFGVTSSVCLSLSGTLIHEIGHNLGCNHAPDDSTGRGAFDYSFGYKHPKRLFHTVMAYDCLLGCPAVLHFSNPDVLYQGEPTGTATQNNARSINNVRHVVANFRASVPAEGGSGGTCSAKKSKFKGCKGGGCKICAEKIADYPDYLANHPGCIVNAKCKGKGYVKCSTTCPAPTDADR
jgi:hypothetical protein